jgi:hypothetical protein
MDLSTSKSLENIYFNEFVPKYMDPKVSLVSDVKFHIRETFWKLHSETFYSCYLDLFAGIDGILLNDGFIRDEGVFGRRLSTSSKISSLDQVSTCLDKEWEIYEIF